MSQQSRPTIPPDAFVATSEDDLMLPVHAALADAANAGRPAFTLVLEPGTYRNLTVGLDTTLYGRPPLDVHVVGRGPRPAVLHDCQLNVAAASIYLHNLVVTGYDGSSVPLQLQAAQAVHVERAAFLGNRCGDPPPHHGGDWSEGRVVSIQALRKRGTPPATIRAAFVDCWFVDNGTYGRDDLDGFDAVIYTDDVDELNLERCLLVDNEATSAINPNGPVRLTLEQCLVQETRLRRAWVDLYANSALTFARGLCAIGGRFVWLHIGADTPRDQVHPLVLRDSRAAWVEPPPPRLVQLENCRQVPMPARPAGLADLALDGGRPEVSGIIAAIAGPE